MEPRRANPANGCSKALSSAVFAVSAPAAKMRGRNGT
jgi:hypothetical protein